jgi:hypothetical protein
VPFQNNSFSALSNAIALEDNQANPQKILGSQATFRALTQSDSSAHLCQKHFVAVKR